ncbi:alpha/beta fold hydrolase [Rathayibacter rathayi]|uniref:alpha/beta fold hydrolase n=1 Tax=Rathayibacter rathayi TaxID=33887 RepID=UPI0011B09A6F|nr:alpha/beta hydrolase [Rathayibacter rathayi]
MSELAGSSEWWLPNNTFVPLASSVAAIGSSIRVEIRPNGRNARGPVLSFVATTRTAIAEQLLEMDFIDGCFRGRWRFDLTPLADDRSTRLALTFEAEPRGWVRQLARVVDIGAEHTVGVRLAFERLAALLAADSTANQADGPPARTSFDVTAVDGATLRVVSYDPAGPHIGTAVLLHGWASDASVWDQVGSILAGAGIQVLCPELRGHGASAAAPVPEASMLLDTLKRDAVGILDSHVSDDGALPVVVVGHSGSGLVAIDVATARPSLVTGLVLVSSSAKQGRLPAAESAIVASGLLSRVLRSPRGAEFVLSRTMGPATAFEGRRVVARAFAETAPAVRRVFFDASGGADRRAALSSLALSRMPISVIAGIDDQTVPIADVRATARTAGLLGPVELAGRGHALPMEAPDAVAAEVLAALRARRRGPLSPPNPRRTTLPRVLDLEGADCRRTATAAAEA